LIIAGDGVNRGKRHDLKGKDGNWKPVQWEKKNTNLDLVKADEEKSMRSVARRDI